MKVIAAQGLKVPTEANPREYITDAQDVEIEPTAYYLRRLADHELVEVVGEQENPTSKATVPGKSSRAGNAGS